MAVDPSEPLERPVYHALGCLGFCDVTLHSEEVGLVGVRHRERGAHDGVPGSTEPGRDA